jgi:hypothetical protein
VNRPITYLRLLHHLRRTVSAVSCLELLPQFIRSSVSKGILECFVAAIFFNVALIEPLWGQSPDMAANVPAADEINTQYEYNVKAAFLYSFGRYIEWPKSAFADQPGAFVIGIFGENHFEQRLDRIAQVKTIQGRQIIIKNMASIDELQPCQILYVSSSIPLEKQYAIINKMLNNSVLLVGEVPGFAEHGGGINFFLENGTVRFEINVDAIRQQGLMLDAKLLNLGRKVAQTTNP